MKEMERNDFQEIKVNLFDIKTSEAFRQIDEISISNIAKQLTLTDSEFGEIIKEQLMQITEYKSSIDELKEENRLLKNKIIELETKKW